MVISAAQGPRVMKPPLEKIHELSFQSVAPFLEWKTDWKEHVLEEHIIVDEMNPATSFLKSREKMLLEVWLFFIPFTIFRMYS